MINSGEPYKNESTRIRQKQERLTTAGLARQLERNERENRHILSTVVARDMADLGPDEGGTPRRGRPPRRGAASDGSPVDRRLTRSVTSAATNKVRWLFLLFFLVLRLHETQAVVRGLAANLDTSKYCSWSERQEGARAWGTACLCVKQFELESERIQVSSSKLSLCPHADLYQL